ncbi:MAG: matrixin family metalloprotease [bacterium]|nr:matrixin family metalloprotease [bacterium]
MSPVYRLTTAAWGATIFLALVVSAHPAGATSFVKMSDEELVDQSPAIIEGRVVAIEPAPGGDQAATDYLVEIQRLVKGFLPASALIVRVPGGVRSDGTGLMIRGAPRFAEGDEVLLFLHPRSDGTFALSQFLLGAFHLETVRVGEEGLGRVAIRHLAGARELVVPGKAAPEDGVRELTGFSRWLDDRVAGRLRAKDYFITVPAAELEKFAHAISSTEPFPLGCGDNGGHAVRWFPFDNLQEIFWRMDAGGQEGLAGGGMWEFRDALSAWSSDPNTSVRYRYGGLSSTRGGMASPDGQNTLLFGDPNDDIGGNFSGSGVLALGGPWFSCELRNHVGEPFHPIVEADLVTQDGLEEFFAASSAPSLAALELFAHELGHTLGLDHSSEPEALMFPFIHDDGRGAALDADDLAGVFYLYGTLFDPLPDLDPPAAPTELEMTSLSATWVRVGWRDNSDDESNFRIERLDAAETRWVTTIAADRTSYFDSGLQPESVYTYRLQAQNAAGASAYTPVITVATPEDRRPAAPSNLWAAPLAADRIRLTWQDNADDESAFRIEIATTAGFINIPVTIPPDTRVVEVAGLSPSTIYTFRVRSENAFGPSEPGNSAAVETFEPSAACLVEEDTLCLLGGRFAVGVQYRLESEDGIETAGVAVPITDDSGLFWFFGPENIELLVRMDPTQEAIGVRYGGLSNVEYRVTVTDTETRAVQRYHNLPGEYCGLTDPSAFALDSTSALTTARDLRALLAPSVTSPTDPGDLSVELVEPILTKTAGAGTAGSCSSSAQTLCLLEDRFAVEVDWLDPDHDGSGGVSETAGQAVAGTDNTGFFWFSDLRELEIVLKVLDGRGLNEHFWVFYGGLCELEYSVTVTDTVTGASRTYHSPAGESCGIADTRAFAADE